jgi:hypothetical protein
MLGLSQGMLSSFRGGSSPNKKEKASWLESRRGGRGLPGAFYPYGGN